MREIKFRAWDKEKKKWVKELTLLDNFINENLQDYFNYILLQYTGLKDKNGKEIYEGDIIKKVGSNLKGNFELTPSKIGDIYFVVNMASGYTLCPIKSFGKLAKTCDNELIPNVWGYIHNYEFWNGASTGAEIIGNIYENSELLKGGRDERT